ncbi:DNA translocase FtsK [Anaerolineae bacterium CFX7]|nr:DNA translocase FtsK [Anaerolineae bacterium CFX7]
MFPLQQRLHLQADRIEAVLAVHKAPVRVTGGRVTPRTIQFQLAPAPTTKISRVEQLAEEIALALGVSAARIVREQGALHVEIPRRDARLLAFQTLVTQLRQDARVHQALRVPGTVLLGLTPEGLPLLVRLGSADAPHLLIAGTTGSGKSQAARSILASLVLFQPEREMQLLIVDPKGSDFLGFADMPHLLCPPVSDAETARERLEWLTDEMTRRQQARVTRPHIVALLDELADLLMQGGSPLETLLARLTQRGRSAGISIVACTQKPTARVMGNLVTANFPARLVGKVTSAHEALVASGMAKSGAEKLAGRGDFLLIANGEKTRVQIAHLPRADEDALRQTMGRR